MTRREYSNLDLAIERGSQAGLYCARIIGSPAGEAGPVPMDLGLSDTELELLMLKMNPEARGTRRVATPDVACAEQLGQALFTAVFHDGLKDALYESMNKCPEGLRVRLRLSEVPELAHLPWELLFDQRRCKFLAQSEKTPLVRYLTMQESPEPLSVASPLRILVVISSPEGVASLNVEGEWAALTDALAEQVKAGRVVLERLPRATMRALATRLRESNGVHVLHFIGHGDFDRARQDGVLLFEDRYGRRQDVDVGMLGPHLHDHDPLRLVVLNACLSARSADDDPFGGVAQGLVERGVPAVVAMQYPITDGAAIEFAGDFYASVAAGQPVDQTLSWTRKMLADSYGNEWATPVLFLRAPTGDLFEIAPPSEADRPPRPDAPKWPRPLAAAAAVLLVAAIVVAAIAFTGGGNTPPPVAGHSSAPGTTTHVPIATSGVPPNVYDVASATGISQLRSRGFLKVTPVKVCSSSVGNGRIRQVVLANEAAVGHETVVIDHGLTPKALPLTTALEVKVSDGKAC